MELYPIVYIFRVSMSKYGYLLSPLNLSPARTSRYFVCV